MFNKNTRVAKLCLDKNSVFENQLAVCEQNGKKGGIALKIFGKMVQ